MELLAENIREFVVKYEVAIFMICIVVALTVLVLWLISEIRKSVTHSNIPHTELGLRLISLFESQYDDKWELMRGTVEGVTVHCGDIFIHDYPDSSNFAVYVGGTINYKDSQVNGGTRINGQLNKKDIRILKAKRWEKRKQLLARDDNKKSDAILQVAYRKLDEITQHTETDTVEPTKHEAEHVRLSAGNKYVGACINTMLAYRCQHDLWDHECEEHLAFKEGLKKLEEDGWTDFYVSGNGTICARMRAGEVGTVFCRHGYRIENCLSRDEHDFAVAKHALQKEILDESRPDTAAGLVGYTNHRLAYLCDHGFWDHGCGEDKRFKAMLATYDLPITYVSRDGSFAVERKRRCKHGLEFSSCSTCAKLTS